MANHINHYKSLKKKTHKIKKRGNSKALFNLPFNFVRIIFCSLFFYFFVARFSTMIPFFFSQALLSSDCVVVCCCYRLSNFIQTIFFPISFIFHFCPDIFSTDLYVCYIFIHISPFAVAISFMRCFHFFCCSLSVCVFNEYCSFVAQSFVWLPESSRYSCHDVCLKHLNCTVLYWNRQKLDLMELLHL